MENQGFTWNITGQIKGYTIRERFDDETFNSGNIAISKNGKRYYHYYWPTDEDRETKTAQQLAQDAFDDFLATAKTGGGLRSDYVRDYGWRRTAESIAEAWREYTNAYKGLMRLDPTGYRALIN